MPAVLLERLPLPSLQTYVSISVICLASALLYTHHTVITSQSAVAIKEAMLSQSGAHLHAEPQAEGQSANVLDWRLVASAKEEQHTEDGDILDSLGVMDIDNITLPYESYRMNFMWVLTSEAWCVWTLVNTVYCMLILVGKLIQALIFGDLRVSEQQHLKDKFWNFVFYKFIFIFGVMNVQTMEEVVLWVAWFTCLGFLHLLVQLCKDRFEYLSFSPTTPRTSHAKLFGLLLVLMCSSTILLGVCVAAGFKFGPTIFAFMAAECILLGLKTVYVMVRYIIHLWDLSLESVWENRSVCVYYSELIFELSSLSIDFAHHLHMLLWGNIFLSMASLVICMQLRYLFYEFQRRIRRHKNYRRVVKNMQARFPMATQEDLEQNADECAICWESMEAARKLPCGHLFHNSCLRSWLEQDTSCPTCRMSLSERTEGEDQGQQQADPAAANNPNMAEAVGAAAQGTINHFFHFDGSRYVSWLPSFSVEVTHTSLIPGQQLRFQTSQLDEMLRQVQMMFPTFPSQVILEDLRQTRSVEVTIDNILENRLQPTRTIDHNAYQENYWENNPNSQSPEQQQESLQQQDTSQAPTEPVSSDSSPLLTETGAMQQTEGLQLSDAVSSFTLSPLLQSPHPPMPDSTEDDTSDGAIGDQIQAQGGRFSKSATERMSMLQQRKNALMDQARKRYLAHQGTECGEAGDVPSTSTTSESPQMSEDDEKVRRRQLLLQATQRRLNNS